MNSVEKSNGSLAEERIKKLKKQLRDDDTPPDPNKIIDDTNRKLRDLQRKRKRENGKVWVIVLIVVLIVLIVAGAFYYFVYYKKNTAKINQQIQTTQFQAKISLDPQKEATHLSKVLDTKNAYWMRGGFDLSWNVIEPAKGKFDWDLTDQMIKELTGSDIYLMPIVKPFTNWDQDTCHPEAKYQAEYDPMKGGKLKVGTPCDINAYKKFLTLAVERYDGDGTDDMPGLKIPIKYWEILNEPEMQGGVTGGAGEELKFFVGTPQEYLEILKVSFEAIKQADSEAKVAPAGMAGMQQNFQDFWDPIFSSPNIGDYFDIANIHTINTDNRREDLYFLKFYNYLKKFGLEGKPIWITEVQYGELMREPADIKSFDALIVKSTAFALALGADKLFYIDNWLMWNEKNLPDKNKDADFQDKKEKSMAEKSEELDLENSSTQKVYLNLVDKINNFDKVETIKEEYQENSQDFDGATSIIGQYKFISNDKEIYVLWGQAELTSEISGRIKATDIYGQSQEIDAQNIKLTNEPIFVEKL